jgi:hypothetical protein
VRPEPFDGDQEFGGFVAALGCCFHVDTIPNRLAIVNPFQAIF